MDGMRANLAELIEKQNMIIKEQADIIDDLFLLLLQHISAEELDGTKETEKINHVAALKESVKNISLREGICSQQDK